MKNDDGFPFFCPAVPGFETELERELLTLGLHPYAEVGGFFWKGSWRDLYRANLCLRTTGRVLLRMASFEALTFAELEESALGLPWQRFLGPQTRFKLQVTCTKSKLYHEEAVAERLADWMQQRTGAIYDPQAADGQSQLFVIRAYRDRFTISVDTSGEHLHRRGYRQAIAKAPLRETLAAAILGASGWIPAVCEGLGRGQAYRYKQPQQTLVDPFCGSGTIVIEAALAARKIPPGLANAELKPRAYTFQTWSFFDSATWDKTVSSLQNHVLPQTALVLRGSDRDRGAIAAALSNAQRAGVAPDVEFEVLALSNARLPEVGYVVTNPPYGLRISEKQDLRDLYQVFGQRSLESENRVTAWICADPVWKRNTPGHWQTICGFPNGGLDLTLVTNLR